MRLAFLGLAAFLSALPLSAETFSHVSQSKVTLAVTYSRAGDFDKTDKKRSDGDYNVSFRFSTIRFGNSQLLDILVEEEVITEKKGWALVATWADWESTGSSSYRFFVRKKISGGYDFRRVPPGLLNFELLDPYVIKTLKTQEADDEGDDEIISGSDQYKAYSRLTLGADSRASEDPTDPAERRITASAPLGMIGGSGRYARVSGAEVAFYLPDSASFVGYDISDPDSEAEDAASDVVVASLKLGKSSAVLSSRYLDQTSEPPVPLFTGEKPSLGPDSTAVVVLP